MRKKLLYVVCICMVGTMGLITGCSEKKTEDKAITTEKKDTEIKIIGKEDKDAFEVQLKNSTGKNIIGVSVKLTDENDYPKNMLESSDIFKNKESRILYYKVPSEMTGSQNTSTESGNSEKQLEQGYDIQLTFEDKSTTELHSFPFEDIEQGEICYSDDVAYISYTSVKTKEKLNTKEAELVVKETEKQKAEEEAAKEAEQKAAEQKATQDNTESQVNTQTTEQNTVEETYQQPVEQQIQNDYSYAGSTESSPEVPNSSDAGSDSSGSAAGDGCLDDGLLY